MDQRGREGVGGMKICILIEGLRQFCVKKRQFCVKTGDMLMSLPNYMAIERLVRRK